MSFNVSPQPRFWPPPFPSSPLTPIVPSITNPVPGSYDYLTQNYWQGAVRINQGNSLNGYAALPDITFNKFVCSFWATNLFTGTAPDFNDYAMFFGAEGTFDLNTILGPTGGVPFTLSNFLLRLESNGALGLYFLNSNSTGLVGAWHGPPDTLGETLNNDEILPLGVWHHYIISFDGATNRCQVACDRGGGPNWGGGVMDTNLGNTLFAPTVFHPGTVPQAIWGGSTAGIPTSFRNPSNLLWRIQAPNASSIDLAYFYFGVSASFFDLTISGNLDYFVTSSLLPVNLGAAGKNVTPLTCLIMHTGNATNPFGAPTADPWGPDLLYGLGKMANYNGKIYYSIFVGINIGNRPDISPGQWALLIPTTGFQFPYNAVTGKLWGGTIQDAPTEPPVGA